MAVPSLAHPGQLLGLSSAYVPGPGTHLYGTSIIASLAGRPVIVPAAPLHSLPNSSNPAPPISNSLLPILTIPRTLPSPTSPIPSGAVSNTNTLPAVGSIVLCRVTRLTPRQVDVLILVVGEDVCGEEWRGVLRREDVRIGDKGESAAEGFRVGDLVRGRVVSWTFPWMGAYICKSRWCRRKIG